MLISLRILFITLILTIFDKALIISADSDLCSAIKLVIETHPTKEVEVLVPPNRYDITRELRKVVKAHKIKRKHLENNQLPNVIKDKMGTVVTKRPYKYFR